MTGINALFYVASSIPPWWLTDAAGRRPILLTGAIAMALALIATGWWIYIDQAITPNAVVVCVIIYNAAFGMSWGPIPWLYPPEIMPLPFRAKGVSLSTATVSEVCTALLTLELARQLLGGSDNTSVPRDHGLAPVHHARLLLCHLVHSW